MTSVLLIGPRFFGYEDAIAAEFERRGAHVTFIDERPSNSSVVKAAARVAPWLIRRRLRIHYQRAARFLSRPFDLVLVIKAEVVPQTFLDSIPIAADGTRVFYNFDSFSNSPRGRDLLPFFDRAFSFDRGDVDKTPGLEYKPLFAASEFVPGPPIAQRSVDLAFVGTLHSDRYAICRRLSATGVSTRFFFYSPARWHYWVTRATSRTMRQVRRSEVSFRPLKREEVAARFQEARAVIDVQRFGQTGLTMRTFEVLASGARLVTTNAAIVAEPFYDATRVHVLPASGRWNEADLRTFLDADTESGCDVVPAVSLADWVDGLWALVGRAEDRA